MAASAQSLREPRLRATRASPAGPLVGLIAQVVLLAGVAGAGGLGVGGGIAALVVHSFGHGAPVTLLVAISAVALALDYVDGWIARRARTTATLGAQFDGEADAFL